MLATYHWNLAPKKSKKIKLINARHLSLEPGT